MKRYILLALLACILLTAAGCSCRHDYEETIIKSAGYFQEGEKHMVCKRCGEEKNEVIPEIKTIKILAIGNSFSVDAMEHLWNIFTYAGFEKVLLGNLYIGGCSLDTHYANMQSNAPEYIYYYNNSGTWQEAAGADVISTLGMEDWDIITIQQASADSGKPETYGNLQGILDMIQENKTNADAKIYWHMTWAYQADSDHGGFAYYDNDQLKMYNAITATVGSKVEVLEDIAGIIPSGTAIQNLRTSEVGDTLTRDGYHLSLGTGRYTAALTWFAYLTGLSPDMVDFVPSQGQMEIKIYKDVIRQSVKDAVEKPFEVTAQT